MKKNFSLFLTYFLDSGASMRTPLKGSQKKERKKKGLPFGLRSKRARWKISSSKIDFVDLFPLNVVICMQQGNFH